MAYEVVFSKEAIISINQVVDYLELTWSQKTAHTFIARMYECVNRLATGILEGKLVTADGVRSILITKQNKLYYEVTDDTLHLLLLWDTRQNPAKNPYD